MQKAVVKRICLAYVHYFMVMVGYKASALTIKSCSAGVGCGCFTLLVCIFCALWL